MLRALHQAVVQRNEEATRDVVADLAEKVVEGWGLRVEGWGLKVEGWGLRVEGWGVYRLGLRV